MRTLQLACVFVLTLASAFGQSFSSVSGNITDATGSVVVGATVELSSSATGFHRTTTSETGGTYSFLQVPPGLYRLTAKAPGFATKAVERVTLQVNTPATIVISLEV